MDLTFFPFQPSDAQCPCAPGYRSLREDRRWDCVKETYDICRDDAIRNQDGRCLTKEEWAHYCSDQVSGGLWEKATEVGGSGATGFAAPILAADLPAR